MNKRLSVLAVLLPLTLPVLYADIWENFEKGGAALWGGGSFYIDFGHVMDPADEYIYWRISLEPGIDSYVADNLTFFLNPRLSYSYTKFNPDNINASMTYGVMVGFRHYFVGDPKAQRGLVRSLGVSFGIDAYPGVDDKRLGVTYEDRSLWLYAGLSVPLRLYYFLNDRLAPYIGLSPSAWYLISAQDSGGMSVTVDDSQRLSLDATFSVGMSFFIEHKKAVLFDL